MAETDGGHGVLVACQDQSVVCGEIRPVLVVDVRVEHDLGKQGLIVGTQLVDGDELLVQVVERRPSRFESVLEGDDVAGLWVLGVQVTHGMHREADEGAMVGHRQTP